MSINRSRLLDLACISLFLVYALLYALGRWSGAPSFDFLEGDIANSTSFAAAYDHPELFKGDALLGNEQNIKFYWVFQIPLIQLLTTFTGNYGLSACMLIGPVIFLQLSGFYLLGRVLFSSPLWAFILAVFTAHIVPFNLDDFWGIYYDALPRVVFQSLLGFLLAAVFYYREQPRRWPWIMLAVGLLMYVHPVSTPGIAFSIWLAFALERSTKDSIKTQAVRMLSLGGIFILAVIPFMTRYLGSHEAGSAQNFDEVWTILSRRYARGYLDIPLATSRFLEFMWNTVFVPLGVVGLFLLLLLKKSRARARMLAALVIGLVLVGFCIPFIEQEIAMALRRFPPEVDLVRSIRYLIPLMMIALVWAVYELSSRVSLVTGLLSLWLVYFFAPPPIGYPKIAWAAWKQGNFIPTPTSKQQYVMQNIQAIRENVPEGQAILVAHGADELVIRYSALRPVVHSYKDGGALGYSNHRGLIEWSKRHQQLRDAYGDADPLRALVRLTRQLGARYLVVGWDMNRPDLKTSKAYSLVKILYSNSLIEPGQKKPQLMAILDCRPYDRGSRSRE